MRSTRSSAWPSRPSRSVRSRIVPLGPSSIRKLIDTRSAVLDDAIQDGHIDRNPARGKRVRVRVPQRTFLELDELPALIDAA
jgi:hypothetical protein